MAAKVVPRLLAKTSTSNNNNKSVRGNVSAHTHLWVISFNVLVKSFSGFFVLFIWNKRWTNKGKWSSFWPLSYTALPDQDGRFCCLRRVHHQTGSFLELTSVPIIFNSCPRLCSPPNDDTVIFWNISLTVGTTAAPLCSPFVGDHTEGWHVGGTSRLGGPTAGETWVTGSAFNRLWQ